MTMKTRFLTFLIIIATLFLTNCSKQKYENKIIGTWKQISVGQIPAGTTKTWTFNADQSLYRTTTSANGTSIDTAHWNFDLKLAHKNYLSIDNLDPYVDGKHMIHELGNTLKLQRVEFSNGHTDGSFQWNEFEKQ